MNHIKHIVFVLLALTLAIGVSPVFAKQVSVANTDITFEAPDDFEPLSPEIIAIKWPTNRAPAFAIGTANGATTIAYDLKASFIPQNDLPKAQQQFTKVFERLIPGLEWKKNEIIAQSGQNWILMEMTSNAIDTNIHNMMLITGYQGKLLLFNFNSTKEDFPKYEDVLRKSISSVKLPVASK